VVTRASKLENNTTSRKETIVETEGRKRAPVSCAVNRNLGGECEKGRKWAGRRRGGRAGKEAGAALEGGKSFGGTWES